ncbi:glycerophosphodiester phosphodiesterase [Streptomyces sedi]|uniref:Glycerophosphodiester phosphodiesterase n=1 Tax=Streptomyces sedi TaxID=555059 RepID=A0A5C4V0V9_9ACTN|nr:glycerophosphodiester phosphodiesterase family protein [Streptomyces sedi]TNM29504.1 glycerophosphodiester phosphodiesterase [Streptomyces sedi]
MSDTTSGLIGWALGAVALTVLPVASLPGLSPQSAGAASSDGVRPAATTGLGFDDPLVVAHRGASGYAPENTLAAAEAAAQAHTTWVETDVQRTSDGELVLMHDETLNRTTDVEEVFPDRAPWRVEDFTAEEISRLDAGSWFGEEFAGEPVPTLEEFLDELDGNRQRLLLELKSPSLYPGIEADILEELDEQGWLREWYPGQRLVLQSFEADSVRTVHELAPRVETGFLGTPPVDEIAEYAEFADQINPRHADLSAEYVESVQSLRGPHGRPLKVYTWTVNDGELATRVAGLGVDGIISDVPDVVRSALRD